VIRQENGHGAWGFIENIVMGKRSRVETLLYWYILGVDSHNIFHTGNLRTQSLTTLSKHKIHSGTYHH
jgi:hypothetical protein